MVAKTKAIQAVCKGVNNCGCGWSSEKYSFGGPGEETLEQAQLSATIESRLGHVLQTAEVKPGVIVTHCVQLRVVKR